MSQNQKIPIKIKIWELEVMNKRAIDGSVAGNNSIKYRSDAWYTLFKNLITYHVRFSNYEDYLHVIKNA